MKVLDLVLKSKWYDMINSGEKKEEYREFKPYWIKRLCDNPQFDKNGNICGKRPIDNDTLEMCENYNLNLIEEFNKGNMIAKDYTQVRFHKGYTSTTMDFIINDIIVGKGNVLWRAPDNEDVFIIKLGKRV